MRIKDARQTFLGIWIKLILEGNPFEVWDGHYLRDFTFVDDVVNAFLMVAASEITSGEVYNLGGERSISLKALADLLVAINGEGKYVIKEFPEARKRIDIGDYVADFSKITQALGWAPQISLEQGIGRTLAYYKDNIQFYL
jgi:nucleoside-diphosphate-sugar epimerase